MSVVEQPEHPPLRLFTVDDERLWDSRPHLSAEEFTLQEAVDDEWDALYVVLAEA